MKRKHIIREFTVCPKEDTISLTLTQTLTAYLYNDYSIECDNVLYNADTFHQKYSTNLP